MAAEKTTVFITGCSPGGIGHAMAHEYHGRGCHVIGTARDVSVLKDLAAKGMSTVALDVTSEESMVACAETVKELTNGKLDILINNAGARDVMPALDTPPSRAAHVFQTNILGPMRLTQLLVPCLIPARGLIINISSASTRVPYLFGAAYSASKAALDTWSAALRMELAPFGVRVMVSVTGTVSSSNTNLTATLPPGSLYEPVADLFRWRLGFSQTSSTMPREEFARRLADASSRGEGWLGGWLGGTPWEFWCGGKTGLVWFGTTFFPKKMAELVTWMQLRVPEMIRRIQAARRGKSE